jgi:transposase
MEYFAGLDVSMAETHICVITRDGVVVHQVKVPSTPHMGWFGSRVNSVGH